MTTEKSSVTQKGQVTIPLRIRKALGLKTGTKVEFIQSGLKVFLRPSLEPSNPFEKFVGALKGHKRDKQEINRWLAGIRDDDSN